MAVASPFPGCQAPRSGYELREFTVSSQRTIPSHGYYVEASGRFTDEATQVQTGDGIHISEVPQPERGALKRSMTVPGGPASIDEPTREYVDLLKTVDYVHWPEYPYSHRYFGLRLYTVAEEPPILQFDATLEEAQILENSPAVLTFELTNATGIERTVRQVFRAPFNFPTARIDPACEPSRKPHCGRSCEGFRLWRDEYVDEGYASPTGEWLGGLCNSMYVGDSLQMDGGDRITRTYTIPAFLEGLAPGSYTIRNTVSVDNPDRVEVLGYEAGESGAWGRLRETLEYTIRFDIPG